MYIPTLFRSIAFAACLAVSAQEVGYLDLTEQSNQRRRVEPTTGSASVTNVGYGDAAKAAPESLQIMLLSLNGEEQTAGGNLVYEATIRNVSKSSVKIPWAPSARDIEPPTLGAYQYRIAVLGPHLVKPRGQVAPLESAALFGSDATGTMKELAPGESVRIRAQTPLRSTGAQDLATFLSGDPDRTRIGLTLWFENVTFAPKDGSYHETTVQDGNVIPSENTLPVHILFDELISSPR